MLLYLGMLKKLHRIINVWKKVNRNKKKKYVHLLTAAYAILQQLKTYNDTKVSLLDIHITE